jgi:hypothetical protein
MSSRGSEGLSADPYSVPESVPASKGNVPISKLSYQVFVVELIGLKLVNPENQSGDGIIFAMEEMRGKSASTRNASSDKDWAIDKDKAFPASWAKTFDEFANSASKARFTPS